MVERNVIWTKLSEIQLQEILDYFNKRNKSVQYSKKLYKKFNIALNTVSKNPELGIKTKLNQIRGVIVDDYILFYEIFDNKIMVLKIWDYRQNPDKLYI